MKNIYQKVSKILYLNKKLKNKMLYEYIHNNKYIHYIMEVLSTDIIVYLVESFLGDFVKTQLMAINKGYYSLRFKFTFNNVIDFKLVNHLDYYNNFTNLIIKDINIILPKKIKYLNFDYDFNQLIEGYIPSSVTHLTFYGDNKRELYEKDIPKSIKNTTFN